jgi:hypothetical protein
MLCVVRCGVPLSASLHNPRQAHKGNIIMSDTYASGAIRLLAYVLASPVHLNMLLTNTA